ncbi:hypothetical protein FOQG_13005 [Fusarium oxysporum f. sp. raphani 54005]|uniref:F-box domain-containing protein n=2 Tax=Fusarium oxysporum f. sp. raphani TaxID=96318 RepID=X0BLN2_FUSOX|nr:hypothetical protein FOQG_13005 [Fusarium oxysporum f. sp. raphani 54005]KAG7425776.1 hypothetical protein Forpi1262_v013107 [Fusarium oxysporum f. sp. raphani]
MNSADQSRGSLGLLSGLPHELLSEVINGLPNADIKNLRLTCSFLGTNVLPRLNRAFISTNPRDIEVFTLIANHDVFRFKITEIIYDDSRIDSSRAKRYKGVYEGDTDDPTRVPYWFQRVYGSMIHVIDSKEEEYPSFPHIKEAFKNRCSLAESYAVYRKLKSQQDEVLDSGRDADALRYGLSRFLNLKRVILSPAAHGILERPLYPTPTIRSLPQGLICPLERGWPLSPPLEEHLLTPWDDRSRQEWRGFCVVTKEIAQHIRESPICGLSELVVESRQLWTGISCRVFDNPVSEEYRDLVTILSHPPLRRLELSLACGSEARENWPSFRSGLLLKALSKAKNLQDLRLYTSIPLISRKWHEFVDYEQNGMPLRRMFPVNEWSNLRRFALSRSFVKQRDIMTFITVLPLTLESLELSFLSFLPLEGNYRNLLQDMRDNLGWRERPAGNRPKLIVFVVETELTTDGAAIDVSHAAMDYMYHHGENPFVEEQIMEVEEGKGTLVDFLDPMYDEEWYYHRIASV